MIDYLQMQNRQTRRASYAKNHNNINMLEMKTQKILRRLDQRTRKEITFVCFRA